MGYTPKNTDPIFMISIAAKMCGMHPQTLRVYEQRGLISPSRTEGNTRMYSQGDIDKLNFISELTAEGVNLEGVVRILEMQDELTSAKSQMNMLNREIAALKKKLHEILLQLRNVASRKISESDFFGFLCGSVQEESEDE